MSDKTKTRELMTSVIIATSQDDLEMECDTVELSEAQKAKAKGEFVAYNRTNMIVGNARKEGRKIITKEINDHLTEYHMIRPDSDTLTSQHLPVSVSGTVKNIGKPIAATATNTPTSSIPPMAKARVETSKSTANDSVANIVPPPSTSTQFVPNNSTGQPSYRLVFTNSGKSAIVTNPPNPIQQLQLSGTGQRSQIITTAKKPQSPSQINNLPIRVIRQINPAGIQRTNGPIFITQRQLGLQSSSGTPSSTSNVRLVQSSNIVTAGTGGAGIISKPTQQVRLSTATTTTMSGPLQRLVIDPITGHLMLTAESPDSLVVGGPMPIPVSNMTLNSLLQNSNASNVIVNNNNSNPAPTASATPTPQTLNLNLITTTSATTSNQQTPIRRKKFVNTNSIPYVPICPKTPTPIAPASALVSMPPPETPRPNQMVPIITSVTSLNKAHQLQQHQEKIRNRGSLTMTDIIKQTLDKGTDDGQNGDNNSNQGSEILEDRTYPSLVVVVTPCLENILTKDDLEAARKRLDASMRKMTMSSPREQVEWMIYKGLIRGNRKCPLHPNVENNVYKLGQYKDTGGGTSGGFVWVARCCGGKAISVFRGTLFESNQYSPCTILKLIYHWACQTPSVNILAWVHVSGLYLKTFFTYLRGFCILAVANSIPLIGGLGRDVLVGILTLQLTNPVDPKLARSSKKIEILGVYEPLTKTVRLRLLRRKCEDVSQKVVKQTNEVLEILLDWVDKDSTIHIDNHLCQEILRGGGFKLAVKLFNFGVPKNAELINYMKRVLAKAFASTMSVLSDTLIQQFLDELTWRERWGTSTERAFENILEHISIFSKIEKKDFLKQLSEIAANPFANWEIPDLCESEVNRNVIAGQISRRKASMSHLQTYTRKPMTMEEISEKALRNLKKMPKLLPKTDLPTQTQGQGKVMSSSLAQNYNLKRAPQSDELLDSELEKYYNTKRKTIYLEPYYYAYKMGLNAKEFEHLHPRFEGNLKCTLCSVKFRSPTDIVPHLIVHLKSMGGNGKASQTESPSFCKYCCEEIPKEKMLYHVHHDHNQTEVPRSCLICQIVMPDLKTVTTHMWAHHAAQEMPYICHICNFSGSIHARVVEHFKMHSQLAKVQCPLCLKIMDCKHTNDMKLITVHLQEHVMGKGKKCPHCMLEFVNDKEFRHHATTGHRDEFSVASALNSGDAKSLSLTYSTMMAVPPKINRSAMLFEPRKMPRLTVKPKSSSCPADETRTYGQITIGPVIPSTATSASPGSGFSSPPPPTLSPISITMVGESGNSRSFGREIEITRVPSNEVEITCVSHPDPVPGPSTSSRLRAQLLHQQSSPSKNVKGQSSASASMSLPSAAPLTRTLSASSSISLDSEKDPDESVGWTSDSQSLSPFKAPPVNTTTTNVFYKDEGKKYHRDSSRLVEIVDYKLQAASCLECNGHAASPAHYPGVLSCLVCRFVTCCRKAMLEHQRSGHNKDSKESTLKRSSLLTVSAAPVEKKLPYMHCECGYRTNDGSAIALHLAMCGKNTCFTSLNPPVKKKRVISCTITSDKGEDKTKSEGEGETEIETKESEGPSVPIVSIEEEPQTESVIANINDKPSTSTGVQGVKRKRRKRRGGWKLGNY